MKSLSKKATAILNVAILLLVILILFPVPAEAAAVHRDFIMKWEFTLKDFEYHGKNYEGYIEIWYDVNMLRAGGFGAGRYIEMSGYELDTIEHDTNGTWWSMSAAVPGTLVDGYDRMVRLVGEAFDTADGPHYEVYDDFEACIGNPRPKLFSLSPEYGNAGTQVILTGENFGDMTTQGGYVTMTPFFRHGTFFDPEHVPVVSWSDNQIVIEVPVLYTKPQVVYVKVGRLDKPGGYVTQESTELRFKITEAGMDPDQLPPTSRTWAHDSIGVTTPSDTWYLAEGCTGGDFETWVLVQNPNDTEVTVDLTFMTSSGPVPGPQDFAIPGNARYSFKANNYVIDNDVSTEVVSEGGNVVCERAMYGNSKRWAHDSIGVTTPSDTWYLAEGCTGGDFETWVLVQNPNPDPVSVDVTFMTTSGPVPGPQDFNIPSNSRVSFNAKLFVTDFNVSTKVESEGGSVICERAMYGGNRTWAHDSIGATKPVKNWYLAEGSTGYGFESWVLVQNPNDSEVQVTLTYMTPHGVGTDDPITLPPNSRISINVAAMAPVEPEVSVKVTASQPVIVERAMYGNPL